MMLYHVTNEANIESLLSSVGTASKRKASIIFTDTPLPLRGENVFVLTVDENEARRYEFSAPLMLEGVHYYRIAVDNEAAIKSLLVRPYIVVTGKPWNEATYTLKTGHPDKAGTWARIWASREGVVRCISDSAPYAFSDYKVKLVLTPHFNMTDDYIIMETQMFGGKQWKLELLAGKAPLWADFGDRWNDWVWDADIQDSAISFLSQTFPGLASQIQMATSQTYKVNKIRAWRIVADDVGRELRRDLGKIQAGSWTSVAAMPLRIAQRAGGWTPPKPKPEFQDPDQSGRHLLVTPPPDEGTEPIEDFVDERLIEQRARYAGAR
jgi:hypothetical protein